MSWVRYNINTKKIDSKRDDTKRDNSKKFIDNIDAILYINLEHRPDRNDHCLNEIRKIDPLLTKTHRIDAILNKINGALGCTLSHIKALQLFLDNLTSLVEKNIVCADALRYHYRFDHSHPYDDETKAQEKDDHLYTLFTFE